MCVGALTLCVTHIVCVLCWFGWCVLTECVSLCVLSVAVCASLETFVFRERSPGLTLQPAGACRRGTVVSLLKRGKI